MATRSETQQQVTRITRFIPKPFNQVIEKLHSSIKQPNNAGLEIVKHLESKENFEKSVNASLGPHDFMLFQQFDHGQWMKLYGVNGGRQVARIILGNPKIAITMLKHDVTAGLFVPVEVLVVEREDGEGTDVIQREFPTYDRVL